MLWIRFTIIVAITVVLADSQNGVSYDETKVLQMLIDCGGGIASLRNELQELKEKLARVSTRQASDTYIRWGKSSCPSGATTIYEGFAAGSHSYQKGAAANHLCLSKKPKYRYHSQKPTWSTFIYGAEYGTHGSIWNNLHNHEIPCAVCHVLRSSTIMIPGRNDCPGNFKLEYWGYLMAGHHGHDAATEFLCFDAYPHADEYSSAYSSAVDHDSTLFFFVEAACGALKCQPYKSGQWITCAMCSYSP